MLLLLLACTAGDADAGGIASTCASDDDCPALEADTGDRELVCLDQFAGGYCGLQGCSTTTDCPLESSCVTHDDGQNYCFRSCVEKAECNENRESDEANCSANFDWAAPDDDDGSKACIPPSSG